MVPRIDSEESMKRSDMLAFINEEIVRLEEARRLLSESSTDDFRSEAMLSPSSKPKRVLSLESRQKIAEAQKRRWAKHRDERK